MNLHYGCGLLEAPGWYNCDASPTLRLQRLPLVGLAFRKGLQPAFPRTIRYGDIVKGLPLSRDSCDAIYCCHVLEHLSLEDCRSALRNTNLYLKPGGTFRCVLPDFEQQVATYLADSTPAASQEFLSYTFLGRKTRPKGLTAILRDYFGNSHHLWMWDYKALTAELEASGFRDIRRCEFGDSRNPSFHAVENRDRFQWALAIECTK
jgi:predicted SAM-dependent methyltransferase